MKTIGAGQIIIVLHGETLIDVVD